MNKTKTHPFLYATSILTMVTLSTTNIVSAETITSNSPSLPNTNIQVNSSITEKSTTNKSLEVEDDLCGIEETPIVDSEQYKETNPETILTKEERDKIVADEEEAKRQATAEEKVKFLEDNQSEENIQQAQDVVNIITTEDKKASFQERIDRVKLNIETKKAEEAKNAEEARLAEEARKAEEAQQAAEQQSTAQTTVSTVLTTNTSSTSQSEPLVSGSYTPTYNYSGAYSYPTGQCTWGAKVLAPWAGNYWGNGGQWGASAAAAGFKTGSTPKVGAIVSWNDGGYGHVAVVIAVDSATGQIQVLESNYGGNQSINNYRGWFNPSASMWGVPTYIYAP